MILTPEFFIENGFVPRHSYAWSTEFLFHDIIIVRFYLIEPVSIEVQLHKTGMSVIAHTNDYTLDEFNCLCRALRITTINKINNIRQTIPEDGC